MYDKCDMCGSKKVWVAAVVKPGTYGGETYNALCEDCYRSVLVDRRNLLDEINDERKNGWLKKMVNLPEDKND